MIQRELHILVTFFLVYYSGSQRGRGPVYRGGRVTQAQGGASHPTSAAQQMNKRQRLFVALFDYDPTTMSPNPDACEEELPFSEGDTIKVLPSPILFSFSTYENIKIIF